MVDGSNTRPGTKAPARYLLATTAALHDWIAQPPFLLAIAGVVFIVSVVSLGRYPAIGTDDTYFSASALHLVTHGTLARTFQRGGFDRFDCFPPLQTLAIAAFYKILGFGAIQTWLPTLLFGCLTAGILFVVASQLAGPRAASVATTVFILDPVTYQTWVSARYDALFIFLIAATLLIGKYCADRPASRRLPFFWLSAGILIGLAGASYYPFAGIALAVGSIVMLSSFPERFPMRKKALYSLMFVAGFLIVAGGIFAFVLPHLKLCQAQMADLSRDYLDPRIGWRSEIGRILYEWRRYGVYAISEMGLPNLLLGIAVLCAIPWASRSRWEFWSLGVATLLFMIFLTAYGAKDRPCYMGTVVALWCLGLALVETRIDAEPMAVLGRAAIKPLVCLAIVVGLIRMALVLFTLAYQWQGRDYMRFDTEVRTTIPPRVAVIGPQTVWYALATQNSILWLYGQGYKTMDRTSGEMGMNEPANLGDVQYVILSHWAAKDLAGLKTYVYSNFRLIRRIDPPFRPLPWAKSPPLDADIYQRIAPFPTSSASKLSGSASANRDSGRTS